MSSENNQTAIQPQQQQGNITDQVLHKINAFQASGEIRLPKDYSASNALKSAWLVLQEVKDRQGNFALNTCTKESIANALLKMVVWGLSPLKKQCDFIMYGNQLTCSPEYTGNIALAKRYGGLIDYKARAIFKGDAFEYEVETEFPYRTKVTKHIQKLENIGGDVIGAYFAYELEGGKKDVEIMNIEQIKKAWSQGASYSSGKSVAHNNFTDQMAIKTVINRGCKLLIRASDDSVLLDQEQEDGPRDSATATVQHNIRQNANQEELTIQEAEVVPDQPSGPVSKEQPASQENGQAADECPI